MAILRNCRVVDVKRGSIRETALAIENEKVAGSETPKKERTFLTSKEGIFCLDLSMDMFT